jgi:hypothetical protein
MEEPPELWRLGSIIMILDRCECAGHTVSYRREKQEKRPKPH